jgi:hypothetical protein
LFVTCHGAKRSRFWSQTEPISVRRLIKEGNKSSGRPGPTTDDRRWQELPAASMFLISILVTPVLGKTYIIAHSDLAADKI